MKNKPYLIALNHLPFVGPKTVQQLLKKWPLLQDAFKETVATLIKHGVPEALATAMHDFDFKKVDDDLAWAELPNQHIITWDEADYPKLLKEIHSCPPVLYAKGQLSALNQDAIAMVGTRKPSLNGKENARRFAFELSQVPLVIVSGLALGVDGYAHLGALDANGQTIAVLGTGINNLYPKAHAALAHKITENGLLLSEFPLNTPPTARHFPQRNRIISGLSMSTLVVEAAVKSGSLITARFALEQNRDVLAIPGSLQNPQAKGCHYLLQQGAMLVTSTQDVIDTLKLSHVVEIPAAQTAPKASNQQGLIHCIGFETTPTDTIMQHCGMDIEQLTMALVKLELDGVIQAVPGGYTRCQ